MLFCFLYTGCNRDEDRSKPIDTVRSELKSAADTLAKRSVAWSKSGNYDGVGETKLAQNTEWKKELEFLNDYFSAPLNNPSYFRHSVDGPFEKWVALRSNLTYDSIRISKRGNAKIIEAFSQKNFWLYESKKNWSLTLNPVENSILGFTLQGDDKILGFHTGTYSFSGEIPSLGQANSKP